jgi:hypothetical protein
MTEQDALALMAEAGALDAGQVQAAADAANPPAPGGAQAVAVPPELAAAAEWFLIPKALAWALTAVFPETAPHYTDEKCMELAGAIAPVAEKYGLSGPGDSPELTLLMGTAFFCVPGYLAYQQRKKATAAEGEAARKGGALPGQADQATHKPTDEMTRGQHGG